MRWSNHKRHNTATTLITTFNPPWLKSNLTKFEARSIKSVGGVRSYAWCGKRQNGTNLHVQLKMANFLWTQRHDVNRLFCAPGHDKGVYRKSPSAAYEVWWSSENVWRRYQWVICPQIGGTISMCKFGHMYAFWVEPKCSLWSLVKIGKCMEKFSVTYLATNRWLYKHV